MGHQSAAETVAALQPLVGAAVRHRTWGEGVVAAVIATAAPAFPGGIAFVVRFGAGDGPGSPYTVGDLWGGARFHRPELSGAWQDASRQLDAILDAARLPVARVSATAAVRAPLVPPRAAVVAAKAVTATVPGRASGAAWARDLLTRDDWVLLDTETTGLDANAEIIDLAVLDRRGTVLLETLLRPRRPIPAQVTRVHGLTDRDVRGAPTFAQIWPRLRPLLEGRIIVAYNVAFDARLLVQTAALHGVALPTLAHECAMRRYAEYRAATGLPGGRGAHSLENACRHHGIPVGGHRAAADCRATLALLRAMAGR